MFQKAKDNDVNDHGWENKKYLDKLLKSFKCKLSVQYFILFD